MAVVMITGQHANPVDVINSTATALADTIAVITMTAVVGRRIVCHGLQFSYDGAPTGGRVFVEDGVGTTIWDVDLVAAADRMEHVEFFLVGSINTDMVITLAAGGAGVIGKLNCQHQVYP